MVSGKGETMNLPLLAFLICVAPFLISALVLVVWFAWLNHKGQLFMDSPE
jgi:hypothetical protein